MALTARQKRFIEEYPKDMNGAQAAIRAGYSPKAAKEHAARLLTDANVRAAVDNVLKSRSEKVGIDAEWVLRRLAQDATADLADLYDDNGDLKPVKEWPMCWRTGLVAGIETVKERSGVDPDGVPEFVTVRKVKLLDRTKLVELIGRHVNVGAFKDKVEHSGEIKTPELKLVLHGTKPAPAAD